MPAAAVIPAPIAYIKIVAVKKLVVEFLLHRCVPSGSLHVAYFGRSSLCLDVYFEKIRVLKAGFCLE